MTHFTRLFNKRCRIENHTRDRAAKTAVNTYTALQTQLQVPCRIMRRESSLLAPDKSTQTVHIRTRILLPAWVTIVGRDRILIEGRAYEVIDVFTAEGPRRATGKVAICKATGMPKE